MSVNRPHQPTPFPTPTLIHLLNNVRALCGTPGASFHLEVSRHAYGSFDRDWLKAEGITVYLSPVENN